VALGSNNFFVFVFFEDGRMGSVAADASFGWGAMMALAVEVMGTCGWY